MSLNNPSVTHQAASEYSQQSRRNSENYPTMNATNSLEGQPQGARTTMAPMSIERKSLNTGTEPGLVPVPPYESATMGPKSRTYQSAYRSDKKGWSRGKKICCCILLLSIAALITIGVLIAFMVRTPTVSYKDVEVVCPNNDWLRCSRETLELKVFLEVDNPNILGATINADLGLFKTDAAKTFIGPGFVDDRSIGARGKTDVTAFFNVSSEKAMDVLVAVLVPPTRDYTVLVEGTVYVHVGLLRPSFGITERFTTPKQNLNNIVGLAASRMALMSAGGEEPDKQTVMSVIDELKAEVESGNLPIDKTQLTQAFLEAFQHIADQRQPSLQDTLRAVPIQAATSALASIADHLPLSKHLQTIFARRGR